jgi:hypothetical protein
VAKVAAHSFFLKIGKNLFDRLLFHAFEMSLWTFVITDLGAGAAGQAFYFHNLVGQVAEELLGALAIVEQVIIAVIG